MAQSDARKREAAAQAYDQGTTAYVAQDYEKAAEWFENAHRFSPAAPALIQATRAHQQAGHRARAATLALALVQTYPDDEAAAPFAEGVLNDLSGKLVRVDVDCDDCTLSVDNVLQEYHSFFVEPDNEYTVKASFDSGERSEQVSGAAGESKSLTFEAPPAEEGSDTLLPPGQNPAASTKPLSPVFTYVGIGLTAALLVGSIASTADTYSGVDGYNDAADKWKDACETKDMPADAKTCTELHDDANDKLETGQGKETRTTVLWIATGGVAALTTVVALALTDWSGEDTEQTASQRLRLTAGATPKGAALTLKGTF
ncbi:MAG TPA: hypothetical protein VJR89_01810 [Polyangiales bacterium]|nr:hypothetical protein [Polyangiales bacterium]